MHADVTVAAVLWLLSLGVALGASETLVFTLTRLGTHVHITASLMGILVALGADSPEITSGVSALVQGSADVGLGVIVGSNIYNLAGLLGLSACLAGPLRLGSRTLTLDDGVNIAITLLAAVLLLVPSLRVGCAAVMMVTFAAYVAVSTRRGASSGPGQADGVELAAPTDGAVPQAANTALPVTVALVLASVILIVAASTGLVRTSLYLAPRMGVPTILAGTFVLAIATSLPNTWAAISLSRRHMQAAAISATFNSNSINLVAAIAIPSLFVSLTAARAAPGFNLVWLGGMTAVALALLVLRHELSRIDGMVLVGLYIAFVALSLTVAP